MTHSLSVGNEIVLNNGTIWTDSDGNIWWQREGHAPDLLADSDALCGAGLFKAGVDDQFRDDCIVHDNMYNRREQFEKWGFDRLWIDSYFKHLMLTRAGDDLTLQVRAHAYYYAVRAVGWMFYYRHPGKEIPRHLRGDPNMRVHYTAAAAPLDYTPRRYGWKKDIKDHNDRIYLAPRRMEQLPERVDLREWAGAVLDQGALGSCTAHAFASLLMYVDRMDGNDDIVLPSRLFIYYNERELEDSVMSDAGASLRDGIKSLNETGSCPEKLWGYDRDFRAKPDIACYEEAKKHLVDQYRRIVSLQDLKTCLADGNPVVFGFAVYESFQSEAVAKSGAVPVPKFNEQMLGGHAVLAVGYDDAMNYLIVKNSWGAAWGQKGYLFLPYSFVTEGLADDFWTLTHQM